MWPLIVGLPLIVVVAVAAIALSGGGEDASRPASDDRRQTPKNGGNRNADLGTPALGSADAPVVLTEYSDYQ